MKRWPQSAASDGIGRGERAGVRRFGEWSILLSFCLLTACSDGEYANKSDEEIRAEAVKLPLEQRYDFYIKVLENSNVPPNEDVKYDIVALGDPAWRYTIKRMMTDPFELNHGLDVLDAFGRYCTKSEYRTLRAAAKRLTYDGTDDQKFMLWRVDHACGVISRRYGPETRETLPKIR